MLNIFKNTNPSQAEVAQYLRYFMLALIALGLGASTVELILIGHYKEFWQWIPFICIVFMSLSLILFMTRPNQSSLRFLQIVMWLTVLCSLIGVYQHFHGNQEFALEIKPNLKGWPLFIKTIKGGIPLLAPGMMIQIALLSLAYSFRHPRLSR
ncbi:MAG: hypothetical protein R2880_13230 [Deinococcales bacterium]